MRLPTHKLNPEELPARFPRLARAMRWAACLSHGEAGGCLYMLARGDNWSSEAVNHFGGTRKVLAAAIASRHYVRTLSRPRLSTV